ncbi:MAG TPA: acyl carrier protein [Bacteroidia bacterium]|nr:acyl carrier protein [Bacteroidia bacterium]
MDKEQIIERLTGIVQPYVSGLIRDTHDPLKLTGSEHLINDLKIDSIDVIEIMLDIEKAFDIHVEDNEIGKLVTLNDLTELICEKIK